MVSEHPPVVVERRMLNGKPVYEITVNEVINFNSAFTDKELCSVGTFCGAARQRAAPHL